MSGKIYKERITCRSCGGGLDTVLDLGEIYLNDFVDKTKQPLLSPLTLVKCKKCDLTQLKHSTNLDLLYRQYWYKSSLNKSMILALQDIVANIQNKVKLLPGDVVIDIGCNDGTLLNQYTVNNLYKIGFDPAINLYEEANNACNEFYNTYFGDPETKISVAKVITSIAMFYDLEDPNTFIELIKKHLSIDGIWVIQFTDLLSQFKINAFDNICHEHLEYYSFKVLHDLMKHHDLSIFDIQKNDVNGGSIRAYVCHKGSHITQRSVLDHLKEEDDYMKSDNQFFKFSKRVENIKNSICNFIFTEKVKGKRLFVMGASTKGNTTLQYFKLNNKHFDYAAEVNKDKFGKMTVGTNIPIISEEEAIKMNPDYFFILPWHFINGLIKVHYKYLENGGIFIVPMPEPTLITIEGGEIVKRIIL